VCINWGLWFPWWQWQNCESKQASGWGFDSKPTLLRLQRDFEATGNFVHCLLLSKLKLGLELKQKNGILTRWGFDSKPILLWLQLYFEATGNFVPCLQLSKLKLGLELKQIFAPKPLFLNNSNPTLLMWKNAFFHDGGIWGVGKARLTVCGFLFFPWPWYSWVCCSSVDSVQGSCFSVTVEFVSLL